MAKTVGAIRVRDIGIVELVGPGIVVCVRDLPPIAQLVTVVAPTLRVLLAEPEVDAVDVVVVTASEGQAHAVTVADGLTVSDRKLKIKRKDVRRR